MDAIVSCFTIVIMLIALAVIGGVIDMIVPGKMPYGLLGGIAAAIVGGLLGALLLGTWGPYITAFGWTLYIFPALIGAIILGFIVRFLLGMSGRKTL
jgi:uncharacterized membrane protein YeaQ/YmgE (transglycosylase-associated protein family)